MCGNHVLRSPAEKFKRASWFYSALLQANHSVGVRSPWLQMVGSPACCLVRAWCVLICNTQYKFSDFIRRRLIDLSRSEFRSFPLIITTACFARNLACVYVREQLICDVQRCCARVSWTGSRRCCMQQSEECLFVGLILQFLLSRRRKSIKHDLHFRGGVLHRPNTNQSGPHVPDLVRNAQRIRAQPSRLGFPRHRPSRRQTLHSDSLPHPCLAHHDASRRSSEHGRRWVADGHRDQNWTGLNRRPGAFKTHPPCNAFLYLDRLRSSILFGSMRLFSYSVVDIFTAGEDFAVCHAHMVLGDPQGTMPGPRTLLCPSRRLHTDLQGGLDYAIECNQIVRMTSCCRVET